MSTQQKAPPHLLDVMSSGLCISFPDDEMRIAIVQKREKPRPWVLPGGRSEFRKHPDGTCVPETPEEAARREIEEETRFSMEPRDILFLLETQKKKIYSKKGIVRWFPWYLFACCVHGREFDRPQEAEISIPLWVPPVDVVKRRIEKMSQDHSAAAAYALGSLFRLLDESGTQRHPVIRRVSGLAKDNGRIAASLASVREMVKEELPWIDRAYLSMWS